MCVYNHQKLQIQVQAIAAAVWTDEVKEAYRKYLVDNLPEGFTP